MEQEAITPTSAQRAIYLDFEGLGCSPSDPLPVPHLLGVYRPAESARGRGSYTAHLFRPAWKPVANGISACQALEDLCQTLDKLVQEALSEERILIYWSTYEAQAIAHHCPELADEFKGVGLNLKPPVDKMVNRLGLAERLPHGNRSLAGYMKILFPNTTELDSMEGGPAQACRRLDSYCSTGRRWRSWPESHKNLAKTLIDYNRSDCRSTWRLAVRLTNHLSSRSVSVPIPRQAGH